MVLGSNLARWLLAIALAGRLALTPTPPPDQAEVVARAVNGTTGTPVQADVPVTLYALSESMETVVFTRTAQTDAQGQARFSGLEAAPGTRYAVVVEYGRAAYFAQPQALAPGQTVLTLTATVYEPTADPGVIRVDQWHVIPQVLPGRVQVGEMLVLSNTGERAFVDEQGLSVRVTLPAGATDLQFQSGQLGESYVTVAGGFADTQAIPPGERVYQLLYSYNLPYDGQARDIQLTTAYPVHRINVLVPAEGVQVSSAQLSGGDVQQTPGGAFLSFSAGPLAPGQTLTFRLSGRAAGTEPAASSRPETWALVGALLLVALPVAFYVWRRARRQAPVVADEREALLDQIAALDDAYEAGQLAQSDYARRREALKARLMALMADDQTA